MKQEKTLKVKIEETHHWNEEVFPENKCPHCDSLDNKVTEEPWLERDINGIGVTFKCSKCGLEWREFFTFSHWEPIDFEIIDE